MPTLAIPDATAYIESQFDLEVGLLLDLTVGITEAKRSELVRAGRSVPQPVPVKGLLDTGSTGIALDYAYAEALGLRPTDYAPYIMAGTRRFAPAVYVSLTILMNPVSFSLESQKCVLFTDLRLQGFGALIGREILQHFVLCMNGPASTSHLLMPGVPEYDAIAKSKLSDGAAYYDPTTDSFHRWEGAKFVTYRPKRSFWKRFKLRSQAAPHAT